MKDAIDSIFNGIKPPTEQETMELVDDARAKIDPICQVRDLIHRMRRELESGMNWIPDPNSLTMSVIMLGISLNNVLEIILDENSEMSEEEVLAAYPLVVDAWLGSISEELGVDTQ